jgi:hypothetical protein
MTYDSYEYYQFRITALKRVLRIYIWNLSVGGLLFAVEEGASHFDQV